MKGDRKGFWLFSDSQKENCELTNYRKFEYKLNIKHKFDQLNIFVPGKVDILIIMEIKLNSTFHTSQLW